MRATLRAVRYTPERAQASSSYKAGYESGYEAGRTAALKELESENFKGENSEVKSSVQPSGPKYARESPNQATEPAASGTMADDGPAQGEPAGPAVAGHAERRSSEDLPATAGTAHEPYSAEATDSPAPTETASLHLNGMGVSPLRGSLASLERQNSRLDAEGLERIEDEADLASRIQHKLLVPLPASAALTVNPNLIENHRYCRPWTARFLADLARAHEAAFHRPLEVNSAVRTVEYQKRLMTTNGNAAPAEGDIVSPHLTGATIDIAKEGLSRQEMLWMRSQLLGLEQAGKIDVEEEFEQACFHITVYKSYAPAGTAHKATKSGPNQGPASRRRPARPDGEKHATPLPADLAVGEFSAQGR